jgi:hypothetical protein
MIKSPFTHKDTDIRNVVVDVCIVWLLLMMNRGL